MRLDGLEADYVAIDEPGTPRRPASDRAARVERASIRTHERTALQEESAAALLEQHAFAGPDARERQIFLRRAAEMRARATAARARAESSRQRLRNEGLESQPAP